MIKVLYTDGNDNLTNIELPKYLEVIYNLTNILILEGINYGGEDENGHSALVRGFNYLTDQLVEIFCKEKGLDPSKYSLEFFNLSESEIKEGYGLKLFIFEVG